MSDKVLQVQDLAKLYRLGATASMDQTFREMIYRTAGRLFRRQQRPANDLWALRDVSFDVEQGEVVGIIGPNGAGKSTLLKILSSITEPTEGLVRLRGRVGSLLEVGTGFHPELTGRENIFLNGAILGMHRAEIKSKFDDIVRFAEVEKFIDTPVKRYSSGMYVRLAFAVAAHLEPQILIVDEVLAVGDAAFQKKCLGKMQDVAGRGRTVLFVSHNMATVRTLCNRAILLDCGQVVTQGPTAQVIGQYLETVMEAETLPIEQRDDRQGDGTGRVTAIEIADATGKTVIQSSSQLKVTIHYRNDGPLRQARFLVGVYDYANAGIYLLDSNALCDLPDELPAEGSIVCHTDPINLTPGRCYVNVALKKSGGMADYVQHAAAFDVEADDAFGLRHTPTRDWVLGLIRQQWQLCEKQAA